MGNLFCLEYCIYKWFDLKGLLYGCMIDKDEGEIDEIIIFKDLDFKYVF